MTAIGQIDGDALSDDTADLRRTKFNMLLVTYQQHDTFNADETEILWRMSSRRSYTFLKSRKSRGTKKLKDRFTGFLNEDMAGTEKFALSIQKSKNLLSFIGRIILSTLDYDNPTKG
jgi:hypothetical protein